MACRQCTSRADAVAAEPRMDGSRLLSACDGVERDGGADIEATRAPFRLWVSGLRRLRPLWKLRQLGTFTTSMHRHDVAAATQASNSRHQHKNLASRYLACKKPVYFIILVLQGRFSIWTQSAYFRTLHVGLNVPAQRQAIYVRRIMSGITRVSTPILAFK